jgi:AraC-like DNA-binding protein
MLKIKRYPVNNPMLKTMIKYFWALRSDGDVVIDHKLLPVSNTDFILNLSRPITYITGERNVITCRGFHFNGLHERHYTLRQSGILNVVGVSFFNAGAYPVLKTPLDTFSNGTIELSCVLKDAARSIEDILNAAGIYTGSQKSRETFWGIDNDVILKIENEIVKATDAALIPSKPVLDMINRFFADQTGVSAFCGTYGVHPRTLERTIKRYVGLSPKQCQRISRFHTAMKMIASKGKLTHIAYDNNYYDQSHFIKEFKHFSGCTPTEFLEQKNSILQIIR